MNESELIFSFLIGLIIVAVGVVVMSVVQWHRVTKETEIAAAMRRLRRKDLPSMTVLVYARNQQQYIIQALRTLKNTTYSNYDIVVVDDASTDQTAAMVGEFMARYPAKPMQLLRRRKQTSPSEALRAGYRKSRKGSVVLVVTPDLPLDARIMKRAIAAQNETGTWQVSVQEHLKDTFHLGDIGAFLEKLLWQHRQQVRAYTAEIFLRKHAALPVGARSETDNIGALSVLTALLLVVGASAVFGTQALWYVWVVVTAYGLATIWLRYGESMRDRLVISLSIPLALFLVPAASIVRGFSQLSSRK